MIRNQLSQVLCTNWFLIVCVGKYSPQNGPRCRRKGLSFIRKSFCGDCLYGLYFRVWGLCSCRYAREDALGKLGAAVAEGAQLIEDLYLSFYQELQKPLLTDQANARGHMHAHMHRHTAQAAHESPQSEAAAKVAITLFHM